MRDKGIHCHEGRPNYLTTAHTEEDIAFLVSSFKEAVTEMQKAGFLAAPTVSADSNFKILEKGAAASSEYSAMQSYVAEVRKIPMTSEQMEIWLAAQMGEDPSRAFNIGVCLRLEGSLNVEALRETFQILVDRQEVLRTTFSAEGDCQIIAASATTDIPLIDFSDLDEPAGMKKLSELVETETDRVFSLTDGPLFAISIVKIKPKIHHVIISIHHIVCDGWSMDILVRQMDDIYSSIVSGEAVEPLEPFQFSHYVESKERQKQSAEWRAAKEYWVGQYKGEVPVSELPSDHQRPMQKSYRAKTERIVVGNSEMTTLKEIARSSGSTLFNILVATYGLLIYRLSGQNDVIVGLALAGQPAAGNKNLIGHCVGFFPLRIKIRRDCTFDELLTEMKDTLFDAIEHQSYSFGNLLNELKFPRDPSRLPLVSNTVTHESATEFKSAGDLQITVETIDKRYCALDFELYLTESSQGLEIKTVYNTSLFNESTIRRWLQHFRNLLEHVTIDPRRAVSEISLLSEAERMLVLRQWNAGQYEYPSRTFIHRQFELQAERNPDRPALLSQNEQFTFGEVNRKANQLARHLVNLGVTPSTRIGLCLERSP